jgi:hypothetical protein
VVRGADKDDQPSHLAVSLLQPRRTQLRLCVAQTGDCFYCDLYVAPGQERVERSQVAGDIEGSLELPAPSVADSCAKSPEKVKLRSIAETATGRVEARMEPQADDGSVAGEIRELDNAESALQAADVRTRGARGPRHIGLAQAATNAGVP